MGRFFQIVMWTSWYDFQLVHINPNSLTFFRIINIVFLNQAILLLFRAVLSAKWYIQGQSMFEIEDFRFDLFIFIDYYAWCFYSTSFLQQKIWIIQIVLSRLYGDILGILLVIISGSWIKASIGRFNGLWINK